MEKQEKYLYFEDNNLFKISHKKKYSIKRYIDHLEEIEKIGSNILKSYEIPEKYYCIFEDLKNYHDAGKLLNIWNVYDNKKPTHSFFSALYYLVNSENICNKNMKYLIAFLIFRHHSFLNFPEYKSTDEGINKILNNMKIPKFDKVKIGNKEFSYEDIKEDFLDVILNKLRYIIIDYIESISFEDRVNIADTFGIFKLSDNISGSFRQIDIEKSFSNIKMSKRRLKNLYFLIKKKKPDKNKLLEQLNIVNNSGNPSIIILPTGYGKTFIHLLFISKWKPSRVFYILPTITAIKKFYEELKNIYKSVGRKYYFADTEDEYDDILDGNFLKKINIITVDQFLRTFLQLGKYYSRRFLFRKSLIIFDEFHLLNERMLTVSLHFLKKFQKVYDLKIVFSSATLNKEFLSKIIDEFSQAWINGKLIDNKDFGKIKEEILEKYNNKKRFKLEVIDKDITSDIDKIIEEFNKKRKILVITNTINKAITIYKNLNIKNKILLHSRFTYLDRDYIEKKLYEKLSKEDPFVFISTQISEVSLDVDFDILFTEASSVPSLIQRFGRVNRNGKKDFSIVYLYKPSDIETQKLIYKEINETFEFFKKNKDRSEREWMDEYFEASILDNDKIKDTNNLLNSFENMTQYFFSFTKKEDDETFQKLLNFREAYSVYVLLNPKIINKGTIKFWETYEGVNYIELYKKCYEDQDKKASKILKKFLVPINIRNWKLFEKIYYEENKCSYPTLSEESAEEIGAKYDRKLGLRIEKEDMIIDD